MQWIQNQTHVLSFPKTPPLSVPHIFIKVVTILVIQVQHVSHVSLLFFFIATSNCPQGPALCTSVTALQAKLQISLLTGLSALSPPRWPHPSSNDVTLSMSLPSSKSYNFFYLSNKFRCPDAEQKCSLFSISSSNLISPVSDMGDQGSVNVMICHPLSFSPWNLLFPLGFSLWLKIHLLTVQPIKTLPLRQYPVPTLPYPGSFLWFPWNSFLLWASWHFTHLCWSLSHTGYIAPLSSLRRLWDLCWQGSLCPFCISPKIQKWRDEFL